MKWGADVVVDDVVEGDKVEVHVVEGDEMGG